MKLPTSWQKTRPYFPIRDFDLDVGENKNIVLLQGLYLWLKEKNKTLVQWGAWNCIFLKNGMELFKDHENEGRNSQWKPKINNDELDDHDAKWNEKQINDPGNATEDNFINNYFKLVTLPDPPQCTGWPSESNRLLKMKLGKLALQFVQEETAYLSGKN